jgi:hypothetical protein
VSFGDGNKAIFGAGPDLQIYHDNTEGSIIEDVGAGGLIIKGTPNITFKGVNDETLAVFSQNDASELYHNNFQKLATTATGIDVTGNVVSDGLTVDGDAKISSTAPLLNFLQTDTTDKNAQLRINGNNFFISQATDAGSTGNSIATFNVSTGDISFYEDTGTTAKFFWDASTERLGIGNSAPTTALDVTGTVTADNVDLAATGALESVGTLFIDIDKDNSSTTAALKITADGQSKNIGRFVENGDVSFYESTGTTAKFFWDASAENLQLSLNGEALKLGSSSGTDDAYISFQGSRALVGLDDSLGTITGTASSAFIKSGGSRGIAFNVNNASSSAMVLNTSGNVGIGTSSPNHKLDVNGDAQILAATGSGTLNLVSSENVLNAGQKIAFFGANRSTTDEENAYIKSLMTSNSGGAGNVQTGHLTFGTSGSERVRIDADGNLLVGKTSTGTTNLGTQISGDGYAAIVGANNNIPLYLENKATNGNCRISFANDSHGAASLGLNIG